MEFQEVKQEVLKLSRLTDLYHRDYREAVKAQTPDELLSVIKRNIHWCMRRGIATSERLEKWFDKNLLKSNHIYTLEEKDIFIDECIEVLVIGSSSVNITIASNKDASIFAYNDSKVEVQISGGSTLLLMTHDDSFVKVSTFNYSSLHFAMYDNSIIEVNNCNNNLVSYSQISKNGTLTINYNEHRKRGKERND